MSISREFVVAAGKRLERVEAEDAEAAARKAYSRCSVWELKQGIELTVYLLEEQERWRFQYEKPDGSIMEGWPLGEVVGIRTGVKGRNASVV